MEERVARHGVANLLDVVLHEVLGDLGCDYRATSCGQCVAQQAEHAWLGYEHETIELVPRARAIERARNFLGEQFHPVPLRAALAVDCVPIAIGAAEAPAGPIGFELAIGA